MGWPEILALILGLVGMVGCVLPVIPGPPISWAGLLVLYVWSDGTAMSSTFLWVWCAIMAVVTVLDYIIPAKFTRTTGGTKAAERGSLIGMLVGLFFFPPLGLFIGSFLGALLGEIIVHNKDFSQSIKPALGAFLGFIFSTFLKLVVSGVMLYHIVKFIV